MVPQRPQYEFRIDALSPDRLPLARLAEYLDQLARLFGSRDQVHFHRVVKGCTTLRVGVDQDAEDHVAGRMNLLAANQGPSDAAHARQILNRMLRDDASVGRLRCRARGLVIAFPGRKMPVSEEVTIAEQGELEGVVIRVGGKDETIPVWLRGEDGEIYKCNAREAVSRELISSYLGPPIRVHGHGRWRRTAESGWEMEAFDITSFQPLDQRKLGEVIHDLREVEGSEWNGLEDPIDEWRKVRSGP